MTNTDPLEFDEYADLITDHIYLGSEESACVSIEQLQQRNIKKILVVGRGLKKCYPNIIEYCLLPCIDTFFYPIIDYFEEGVNFIRSAIRDNSVILVHCAQGVSRSATLVAAYLIAEQDLTAMQAITLIRKKRKCVSPNFGFVDQLNHWKMTGCKMNKSLK